MSPRTPLATLGVLGALTLATPALACPPPPPGTVLPTAAQIVSYDHLLMPDIFEAEVTRTIRLRSESSRPGELRITRVYKGNLRVGQLLPFYFNELWTSCDHSPAELFATRGSRGLVVLQGFDPGEPGRFRGFEDAAYVEEFRRQGYMDPPAATPRR
jgi:hypothetical protein